MRHEVREPPSSRAAKFPDRVVAVGAFGGNERERHPVFVVVRGRELARHPAFQIGIDGLRPRLDLADDGLEFR